MHFGGSFVWGATGQEHHWPTSPLKFPLGLRTNDGLFKTQSNWRPTKKQIRSEPCHVECRTRNRNLHNFNLKVLQPTPGSEVVTPFEVS